VAQLFSLGQLAHFMSDIIRNFRDPNFKSMVSKLKAAGWITGATYTPKTADKLGHVDFMWTDRGSLLAVAYKFKMVGHPLWSECASLPQSLNEQEEAFFHENFLAAVPNTPPSL